MKLLLVLLIPSFFVLMAFIIYQKNKNMITSLAGSVISESIFVLFISFLLSLFHALTFSAVLSVWLLAVIGLAAYCFALKKKGGVLPVLPKISGWGAKLCLVALGMMMLITFWLSLFTPQYCGDCVSYHMPRVMHCMNDRTVFFGLHNTYDLREILSPFMSELYVMHAYLLTGTDLFSNLFQWGAYCISIFMIYGCISKLSEEREGISTVALGGSLIFASIPIAVVETTTTQNDLCGTMWVLLFVYTVIDLFDAKKITLDKDQFYGAIKLGVIIGFAYITKTNACVAMVGFLVLLVIKRLFARDNCSWLVVRLALRAYQD